MSNRRWSTLSLTLLLLSGCAGEAAETDSATVQEPVTTEQTPPPAQTSMPMPSMDLTAADQQAIAAVRERAQALSSLDAAKASGYARQYPEGCVQTADGSQGFHFINDSLVDDRVDINTPELVMYEPQADGSMQLIGVDYIIPFDRWTQPSPPQILGRPLMRNEPLGVWAIHIWTHRDNPSGMFAAYNPAVSCTNAAAARL